MYKTNGNSVWLCVYGYTEIPSLLTIIQDGYADGSCSLEIGLPNSKLQEQELGHRKICRDEDSLLFF